MKLLGAILPDLLRQLATDIERGAGSSHDGAHRLSSGEVLEGVTYRTADAGEDEASAIGTGTCRLGGAVPALRDGQPVNRREVELVTDDRQLGGACPAPAPSYPGCRSLLTPHSEGTFANGVSHMCFAHVVGDIGATVGLIGEDRAHGTDGTRLAHGHVVPQRGAEGPQHSLQRGHDVGLVTHRRVPSHWLRQAGLRL